MKTKHQIALIFTAILAFAAIFYFVVQIALGAKNVTAPQDIGKIKYVTSEGNEVFASTGAVVFNRPMEILDVKVENNIASVKVSEFTIIRCPAYGVVTLAQNGTVEINHGNETTSRITGISTLGVKEGDIVYSGTALGTTDTQITFSVSVSELPLDMRWLIESFNASEDSENA